MLRCKRYGGKSDRIFLGNGPEMGARRGFGALENGGSRVYDRWTGRDRSMANYIRVRRDPGIISKIDPCRCQPLSSDPDRVSSIAGSQDDDSDETRDAEAARMDDEG